MTEEEKLVFLEDLRDLKRRVSDLEATKSGEGAKVTDDRSQEPVNFVSDFYHGVKAFGIIAAGAILIATFLEKYGLFPHDND